MKRIWVSVGLNEEEKKIIDEKAKECALTRNKYMKTVAMGIIPRSKYDLQLVHQLAKLNVDVAKAGGLFKMWLSRAEDGRQHDHYHIHELLNEIKKLRNQIEEVILKI